MKKEKKERKPKSMEGKIFRTVLSLVLVVCLVAVMFLGNTVLADNSRMVDSLTNGFTTVIDNSGANTTGLDLAYNKADYTKDTIGAAEDVLAQQIAAEGIVLMQNDGNHLPYAQGTTFSLFSVNAVGLSFGGGLLGGGTSIKDGFAANGVAVNEALWNFYASGAGKGYGLASGSISFGDAENFAINECPLSVLEGEAGLLDSVQGTVPVYVLKRVAGEGRDMPRSMYNHAETAEDKAKTYLEPDSTELAILQYLNDNFDNTVLVVNSNAALELGFLAQMPNIKSVIYMPSGADALAGVLTGNINPSGRTVDTFAVDAMASPAAQNFGDYQYQTADGTLTKYNYISYAEGIYVGYRYYETRYEDVQLGQGNAGNFNYADEVLYPFGHGLSFTSFDWSAQTVRWAGETCTVSLTVTNTGAVSGKEVVQVYAQSPYTEYDKQNGVEKPAVQLVGYAKTGELAPGASETVQVTFEQEQLKSYDANGAKTYILEAGTYYITAAANAHAAVDNILEAKTQNADAAFDFVTEYIPEIDAVDTRYSTDSYSGNEITNRFDEAKGDITYLTRNDWTGTFPTADGTPSAQISTWGNEINGTDAAGNPASYTYTKTISAEDLAKLDSFDSGSPIDPDSITVDIVYGVDNGLTLIELRGLDYDDALWNDLLDQLTAEDYYEMISRSGYGIDKIDSVNKPFNIDADTASGLIYGGTGAMFPNMMTLAQTWNQDLALEYGTMIGNEAILGGADGWYAPSMNLHRTPFSGRNGEYYSEDPFLSGRVASLEVHGAASKGMYTYIKHLAFNDQENHRGDRDGQFGLATFLNEQSARELYLLPFEACMKADDVTLNYVEKTADGSYQNASRTLRANQAVMTAFNRIGYTWTGASYALNTEILRNEWGFNGLIITDNANTGVFMDGYQMIESGADIKLTSLPASARFNFDQNDPATYFYSREAAHHLLYTVANSKAMNGAMPGSVFQSKMTLSSKLIIGINVVCLLLIALMVVLTVRRFKAPTKKRTK